MSFTKADTRKLKVLILAKQSRRVYCQPQHRGGCGDDLQLFKHETVYDYGWGFKNNRIYCDICIDTHEVRRIDYVEPDFNLTFNIDTLDSRIVRRIAKSESINSASRSISIEGFGESFFFYQESRDFREIGSKILDKDANVGFKAVRMVSDCCNFEKGVQSPQRKAFFQSTRNQPVIKFVRSNLEKLRDRYTKCDDSMKSIIEAINRIQHATSHN